MMIDCREATRLNSLTQDSELGLGERVKLMLHLALCAPCRLYRKQLHVLRGLARGLAARDQPGPGLDADARERLRARLRAGIDNEE